MLTGTAPAGERAGTSPSDSRRAVAGPRPPRRRLDIALVAVGLGLGGSVGTALEEETWRAFRAAGGPATFAGRVSGLAGTFLLLVMVLLIARIPWLERVVGQDRLVAWHRKLGQWPVYLLVAHAVLITLGYAQQDRIGIVRQVRDLIDFYPDVLMAVVALGLILAAAALSIRAARRRVRYETWWAAHLYLYLALALSFPHQLANGQSFVGHPLTRAAWTVLWAATAGVVLLYRVGLPVFRTLYHDLRIVEIRDEAEGAFSVICSGRRLDRLAAGGQFFYWRFLARGMWWQAHPYSLSALPRRDLLRITLKDGGDYAAAIRRLRPRTRVAIEGPYGAFTPASRLRRRVVMIAAGVGVTPVRALLEALDPAAEPVVVLRAATAEKALFRDELAYLVHQRRGRFVELIGSRRDHPLDAAELGRLVPDIAQRDVFVCGPEALSRQIHHAAGALGLPRERIHYESFSF